MKASNSMIIWGFAWLALGLVSLIAGNDTVFAIGLVSATVYTVGSRLALLLENNKKENK